MTPISTKIKSKGYWRFRIRPTEYIPKRIANISDLYPLVERLSVQFRGWYFPFVETNVKSLGIHKSHVEQEVDWQNFIELWRFYQSGQFAYLGALRTDWSAPVAAFQPPGQVVVLEDLVAKCAEALEFAARLSDSPAGSNGMWIQIGLHGLQGARLASFAPMTNIFLQGRTVAFGDGELVIDKDIAKGQLLGEAEQLAIQWAQEMLSYFTWNPDRAELEAILGQLRRT